MIKNIFNNTFVNIFCSLSGFQLSPLLFSAIYLNYSSSKADPWVLLALTIECN